MESSATAVSIENTPGNSPRSSTQKVSTKTVDLSLDTTLKQRMNLVVVGHVDHGKSTVVGRLLADTGSLPDGKLDAVKAKCDAAGKRFEYAFLLDALVDEQAQGITIDTARIFFQTEARHYIILDAPGHIEFLRNMITGASHAEAALLVIDAEEGVKENSRRHGSMLALLGVKHLIVLINKMDLVKHSQDAYNALVAEYSDFLAGVGSKAEMFIPISGLHGENITARSANMPWYDGPTVLEALDTLEPASVAQEKNLRMYVQDVYKFTKYGDERRIIAGTVDSGTIRTGDTVVFYPSGKKTVVSSIESFNTDPVASISAGEAIGFTMKEQLYLNRGELAIREGDLKPAVTTRAQVSLFWLGREPLTLKDEFTVKIGTAKVSARIEKINKIVDAGNLTSAADPEAIEKNNVAECILKFAKPLAFDEVEFLSATSRFVVVHNYRIWGGGIVRKALEDERIQLRQRAQARDEKWIRSLVSPVERAERYAQRPALILITGSADSPRRELGKALEKQLFSEGRTVYFMGIGNILYGLDSDLEGQEQIGQEHIRRVAELGNIMLDAGMMLIVSAADLSESDLSLVQELVGGDRVKVVSFGEEAELSADIKLLPSIEIDRAVKEVKAALSAQRYIFGL